MNKEVRTIISCPCCEKVFIENCRYNTQWENHRQQISDFKQFRKYLNLVLSRRNTTLITKETHMKLGEGEISVKRSTARVKDRKSLKYQAEFIAEKKRERIQLQNRESTTRKMNNFRQARENVLKNGMKGNGLKGNGMKYDKKIEDLQEKSSVELSVKREQMWFPNINEESHETGSVVMKFSGDENLKLDIYLPPLT